MLHPAHSLLQRLLQSASPSGYEEEAMAVLESHLSPVAQGERDRMGNLRFRVAGENPQAGVLLVAHADEIGYTVRYIDDEGFLWLASLGGTDPRTLPGTQVTIHGRRGKVPGVMGMKPLHFCSREERAALPPATELCVDIGASSREEAQGLVEPGDPATVVSPPLALHGNRVAGRGLDDRAGCFVLAEALRILSQGERPPVEVLGVFTAQEELGLRGATLAARRAGCRIGVCIETELCTDHPGVERRMYGDVRLGAGPILPRGATVHRAVLDHLRETAKREALPVQPIDLSQPEGTEAAIMQISGEGMATGLLMIPLRYMHSPAEVASLEDLDNAVRLLVAAVRGIGEAQGLAEIMRR